MKTVTSKLEGMIELMGEGKDLTLNFVSAVCYFFFFLKVITKEQKQWKKKKKSPTVLILMPANLVTKLDKNSRRKENRQSDLIPEKKNQIQQYV